MVKNMVFLYLIIGHQITIEYVNIKRVCNIFILKYCIIFITSIDLRIVFYLRIINLN